MSSKISKKHAGIILAATLAFAFMQAGRAQEKDFRPDTENTDGTENEDGSDGGVLKSTEQESIFNYIRPELQRNLTIVVGEHSFDLDPHTSAYSTEAQILTGLYEGLFSYDPVTLNPEYAIATGYRISRNKKRWTFTLRSDAKYSDGRSITAYEIKNSWTRLLQNPNAPFASLFDVVSGARAFREGRTGEESLGIHAIDETTLSVQLERPASHLPKLLCMPAFAAVHSEDGVFSGPFTLESYSGQTIRLVKNELYWDFARTPLERITFIISSDQAENAHLFNTGLADWVGSSVDVKRIMTKDASQISAEFATEYIFFKNRTLADGTESVWNDSKFRAALLEAVPWEKLREGTFVRATSLVYPLAGYPKVQGYEYSDMIEAKSLMDECRSEHGLSSDERLEITFAVTESPHLKNQAKILREAWAVLGVELKILAVPFSEYLGNIPRLDADLFSYTWIGDFADPLAFLELFRSGSTLNITGWKNEEFDRLLDEASLHTDENHSRLLARAEQILLDEAEILPIQHPVSFNVIDLNSVGGWAANAFDIHPLKYLFRRETKPNLPNVVLMDRPGRKTRAP